MSTTDSSFEQMLAVIRSGGASVKLLGMTVTVDGISVVLTDEQFERVWEAMDENGNSDDVLRLP